MSGKVQLIVTLMFALFCASAVAADLPPFPRTWVNGDPVDQAGLKGKLTVLYFYEETCPQCRGRWPEVIGIADEFKGKPIVFIAINSGNEAGPVAGYARGVRLPWPVIVDTDRSFETAVGVGFITNDNNIKVRIVGPDGKLYQSSIENFKASIERHIDKAAWKIDPTTIPEPLQGAWKSVEFGQYQSALGLIQRGTSASNTQIKTAAQSLLKQIEADLDALLAKAKAAEKSGKKWEAYKHYLEATRSFKGLPKATEAGKTLKTLAEDASLTSEIRAMAALENADKQLASRSRTQRRDGLAMLDQIIEQFPNTEAAEKAKGLKKAAAE